MDETPQHTTLKFCLALDNFTYPTFCSAKFGIAIIVAFFFEHSWDGKFVFALRMASKRKREGARFDVLEEIFDIFASQEVLKKGKSFRLGGASDAISSVDYGHAPPF